ncbi:hypothetical protein [Ammoniphilus resinae]|uniref:Uncharacterized protein n=1 Tax=Ammoniphilus resinae TaxID=861532 RepID=A0ABS4GSS8_9BACL|nr:hypothetical protein [Ammoniphilus resinae]MBP1933323.1 hypothetical protein [Ammoniphilus resinae]
MGIRPQGCHCFIDNHTVSGSIVPYTFFIRAEDDSPIFRDFTLNHNKTLIFLHYPEFSGTPVPGELGVTINVRGSTTPIVNENIRLGQTRVYQVEDFESLVITNSILAHASIDAYIQKTFCICCNRT